MKTDQQLLTEYHRAGAEAAFAEFVARHIGWVYSAALRIVVDRHLAEDVTQRVFVAVARHAPTLARRSAVAGWLHRTTHNFAVMTVRTEERRRAREQKAMATAIPSATDPVWDTVAPQLDDAIARLSASDRDAIILHYFERKTASQISGVLGITAEAAQKRVTRAVERLRLHLARTGVTASASVLAAWLATHSVQAVPPQFCELVTGQALAQAAVATSAVSWLPSFHWITAIRTKPVCTGAFAVVILSLGTAGFATGRYTAEKHARAVTWQRAVDGSPPPRAAMSVRQVVAVAGEARVARPVESVSAVFAEAAQILRSENDRYAWAKAFTTMERLVPEQARDAVEELARYQNESKIFLSLAPLVMALWAQTEPRAALDHALAQYKDVTLALSIEYITRAWAEKDPTAAWAWYRERTDTRRIPISEGTWMWVPATIISEWAAHDAAGAFAEFQRMPFSEQERATHGIASAALDAQVRPAILAGISALPNEDERRRVAGRVASKWAQVNPSAAAHWAGSLDFQNPVARLQVLGAVAGQWWRSDPHATAQWLLTNSPPELLEEARTQIRRMSDASSRPR